MLSGHYRKIEISPLACPEGNLFLEWGWGSDAQLPGLSRPAHSASAVPLLPVFGGHSVLAQDLEGQDHPIFICVSTTEPSTILTAWLLLFAA